MAQATSVFAIASLILSICAPNAHGARVNVTNQNAQRISNELPTQTRFLLALLAAQVPGGSVRIGDCSGQERTFRQDPTILPLHDALESITQADQRYQWQMDRGVVNLIPRTGEPRLLKARINRYRTATNLNEALRQLLALPEVKAEASKLGLKLSSGGLVLGPGPSNGGPSQVSVDVKNVSLRGALNALVRAHGRAVWEYHEYRCGGSNEFFVNFLTQ